MNGKDPAQNRKKPTKVLVLNSSGSLLWMPSGTLAWERMSIRSCPSI